MKIYVDGEFYEKDEAKVSVFDHGVLYGDGIFEGIRAYNGRVFRLGEHLKRLEESAQAIFLTLPIPLRKIEEALLETVRQNGLRDAYIRLVVTRGVGDLGLDMRKCKKNAGLIIIADKIELYPESYYEKGLDIITSSIRQRGTDQLAPNIKSLNYLANILARAEATRAGAQEAILLNQQGYVSECSGDNIFYVYEGRIYTPPVYAGILEGVTRSAIIDIVREKMNGQVIEKLSTLFELYRADEVFLTGTGAEVIAGVKIDGHVIGSGSAGPITRKLVALFREYARLTGTLIYEEAKASK
ncbi:MAG: branched-chain-amino-acid transaminase [Elusimicrobia bacterium RIFCSPHIGHO2_02_FULL_57_9]|nr:MAG: branched-chain-amino-acid transaminase [Elusimicrobia bacterium RIFCSPHIGHO2_02_FULL_57_9]